MSDSTAATKRLWFATADDSYYLTYNAAVLLAELGYHGEGSAFRDHRKLAYLIDFIADPALASVLERHPGNCAVRNYDDRRRLQAAYLSGVTRVPFLTRLVLSLAHSELLCVDRHGTELSVRLKRDGALYALVQEDIYEQERRNARRLRKAVRALGRLTMATMLDRLFREKGVAEWGA